MLLSSLQLPGLSPLFRFLTEALLQEQISVFNLKTTLEKNPRNHKNKTIIKAFEALIIHFQNVHRFTLNLQGLKIMIVESFPSNITY